MKLLFTNTRLGRADRNPANGSDDNLGRGMDLALTMLAFLGLGALIDAWLGLFPLFTIILVLFAAIGSFVRLKYVYDATMERLEADRAVRTGAPQAAPSGGRSKAIEGAS